MNKFIAKLFLISLMFTLGLSSVGFADVDITDASYNKEQQKLSVSIACGGGYHHNLFELKYGAVKQIIPMEVTATLSYSGVEGTMQQNACETTLDFDVNNTVKPIYITVVAPDGRSSVRVFVD